MGCAIGCGALVLLGVVLVALGGYWIMTPGQQAATVVVVGPESLGVVRLRDAAADPGMRALLLKVVTEAQKAQDDRRDAPEFLKWLRSWQQSQLQAGAGGFEMWLPKEATLSLEPRSDGGRAPVVAINPRGFVRMYRMMFERMAVRFTQHGRYKIMRGQAGGGFCFADGTVLIADNADLLPPVLDRITSPTQSIPDLVTTAEALGTEWDVYGVVSDAQQAQRLLVGLLAVVGSYAGDEDSTEMAPLLAVAGVRFGVDVQTANESRGRIYLTYATPEAARKVDASFDYLIQELEARAATNGLQLGMNLAADGRDVQAEFRLAGIEGAIERGMASFGSRRGSPERRPTR